MMRNIHLRGLKHRACVYVCACVQRANSHKEKEEQLVELVVVVVDGGGDNSK